jgi:hypothetical protein
MSHHALIDNGCKSHKLSFAMPAIEPLNSNTVLLHVNHSLGYVCRGCPRVAFLNLTSREVVLDNRLVVLRELKSGM